MPGYNNYPIKLLPSVDLNPNHNKNLKVFNSTPPLGRGNGHGRGKVARGRGHQPFPNKPASSDKQKGLDSQCFLLTYIIPTSKYNVKKLKCFEHLKQSVAWGFPQTITSQ